MTSYFGMEPRMLSPFMRWTLLVLLSMGMVIAYVDRINLSVDVCDDHSQA